MSPARSPDPLSYAVRLPVVGKYLGQLAIVLAIVNLVPLGTSLFFGDAPMAWRFATVAVALLAGGAPLARRRVAVPIQANEALAVSALAYVLAAAATAYPLASAIAEPVDAWLEGVSAVTTTGLSTVAHVDAMPRSFLFARGLGAVVRRPWGSSS